MKLLKRSPKDELRQFIKNYWILDITSEEEFRQRIIPFGSVDLIIHLKSPMRKWDSEHQIIEPNIFLEGQYLQSKHVESSSATLILGVSFYPWATKTFFNHYADEFSNCVISYDLVDPKNLQTLFWSLDPADSYDSLFLKIDQFFLNKKRKQLNSTEQGIKDFLNQVSDLSWDQWSALYKTWGTSIRSREQVFKRLIGIDSKKLYSKIKFQNSFKLLESSKPKRLTDIALEAGYYDQSDFCRHFKRFVGISPMNYIKEGTSCFGQLIT